MFYHPLWSSQPMMPESAPACIRAGIAGRTVIFIVLGAIFKIALSEITFGLVTRGLRLGDIGYYPGFLAGPDLFTTVVTPVRHNRDLFCIQGRLCL